MEFFPREDFIMTSTNEDVFRFVRASPMQIHAVIECLFEFLNLRDIKNCRYVCRTWNYIAEPFLRKRSRITFGSSSACNVPKFLDTFSECQTEIPFTTFRLIETYWPFYELDEFLQKKGKFINELYLHYISFQDKVLSTTDISSLLNTYHISTLSIKLHKSSPLNVSLKNLEAVKHLELVSCKISTTDGFRIAPLSVNLNFVTFYRNGEALSDVRLNDFFNIRPTKQITLCCSNHLSNNMSLDLSEALLIDNLTLNAVTLENWRTSRCTVNNMHLSEVTFLMKTQMKITQLHFKNSSIDLCALPQDIERISLESGFIRSNIVCSGSGPIVLNNLRSLSINSYADFPLLRHFLNCSNLVDIHLSRTYGHNNITINLDWIPKSVKRLKMQGIQGVSGNSTLSVDVLILNYYTLLDCQKVLQNIKPKNILSVNWMNFFETADEVLSFVHSNKSVDKLFIGPFAWHQPTFSRSSISWYVDREAEFYIFENGLGTGAATAKLYDF